MDSEFVANEPPCRGSSGSSGAWEVPSRVAYQEDVVVVVVVHIVGLAGQPPTLPSLAAPRQKQWQRGPRLCPRGIIKAAYWEDMAVDMVGQAV